MGQVLYRKYRSRSFDEVVGQKHITDTLKNAIKTGNISHAYLFTGPRGVGKTSVARILAHEINNLKYDESAINLDIIEIDAASNRRIDEIRDLRDKVHIAPTSSKYKVYIIDEVHMLTREAFNALLKTLEEPPEHCIFILATTEAHKLPETIISRTQRFEFKPISTVDAVDHLAKLAKEEKIKISKDAIKLLAEHGRGSFRDSISLLDQISSTSNAEINEGAVRAFLGLPSKKNIDDLVSYIVSGNPNKVMDCLFQLRAQGSTADIIAVQISDSLRETCLREPSALSATLDLMKQLLEVPASPNPDYYLEIILIEATLNFLPTTPKATQIAEEKQQEITKTQGATDVPLETAVKAVEKPAKTSTAGPVKPFDDELWEEITLKVRDKAASVYTALRFAQPTLEGDKLLLAFKFPLHQKKINQAKHKDLIAGLVKEMSGLTVVVETSHDKNLSAASKDKESKPATKEVSEEMDTISNIFGDTEVLES